MTSTGSRWRAEREWRAGLRPHLCLCSSHHLINLTARLDNPMEWNYDHLPGWGHTSREINMTSRRLIQVCAASFVFSVTVTPASAQTADPEAIVNALFAASGNHPNVRAGGAKGVCVKGSFTPSSGGCEPVEGPSLRKDGPGDGPLLHVWRQPQHLGQVQTRDAGLCRALRRPFGGHGLRVHLRPDVRIQDAATAARGSSGRAFRARTESLMPRRSGRSRLPTRRPARQAAWLNARPVPASFAGVDYWAVHAFTLTNAHGEAKVAKLKAVATAGQLGLSDEELKAKPDNFYVDELKERLAKGPASFELVAILGEATDPTDDVTAAGPRRTARW